MILGTFNNQKQQTKQSNMKLRTFNAENSQQYKKGECTINVTRAGSFTLSKDLCEAMGIKAGDKIAVHQDELEPTNWYLSKSDDGFTVHDGGRGDATNSFNNARSAKEILMSIDNHDNSVSFYVARKAEKIGKIDYHAIMTSKPKKSR